MGCDIHGVFQKRDAGTGEWRDVSSTYEQWRQYGLFGVLAGVRHYPTPPLVPIAEQRGYPPGFMLLDDDEHPVESLDAVDPRRRAWGETELVVWMGDHSHSWLSGEEILEWAARFTQFAENYDFFAEVRRLQEEHGEVRFVFGFDS